VRDPKQLIARVRVLAAAPGLVHHPNSPGELNASYRREVVLAQRAFRNAAPRLVTEMVDALEAYEARVAQLENLQIGCVMCPECDHEFDIDRPPSNRRGKDSSDG